jgi:hypothetical protein
MEEPIVWLIILLFYAPLHYLLPLLIVFLRHAEDPEARRQHLKATAIDCTFSMVVGFSLVLVLAQDNLFPAMLILLVSLFTPYLRIALARSGNSSREADHSS